MSHSRRNVLPHGPDGDVTISTEGGGSRVTGLQDHLVSRNTRATIQKEDGSTNAWQDDDEIPPATSSSILYPSRRVVSPRRTVHKPSPRKRPVASPRISGTPLHQGRTKQPPIRPALSDTLSFILAPLRILLTPLNLVLSPILSHMLNVLILASLLLVVSWWLWPYVAGLLHPFSYAVFLLKMPLAIVSSLRPSLTMSDLPHFWTAPQQAVQGLWCDTVGYGCHPIVEPGLNPVMLARALTQEARAASDIFGSIVRLGDSGAEGGLHHLKILELASTIMTESNLDEKQHLGKQLKDLGYATRDISDDMDILNSKAISTFDWMTWQFESLTRRLAESPNSPLVARSLHSLLVRLSTELGVLEQISSELHRATLHTEELGSSLIETLGIERHHLKTDLALSPPWRRALDRGKRELIGGEKSKGEIKARDVELAQDTIENLSTLRANIDQTRRQVKLFRNQVSEFDAGIMGFHLGTDDAGIPLEEEIAVLSRVVQGLEGSVKEAKARALVGW